MLTTKMKHVVLMKMIGDDDGEDEMCDGDKDDKMMMVMKEIR